MLTSTTGPFVISGNTNPQQLTNSDGGPNIDYQGNALLDSRFVEAIDQASSAGGIPCWYSPQTIESWNFVPTVGANANIAAAQAATNGGFFTLASANASGVAVNIPLCPITVALQPTAAVVKVLALDFGNALGTTTTAAATNQTITLTGPVSGAAVQRYFRPGQFIIVPGAGVAGAVLITKVVATNIAASFGYALAASGTITVATGASTVVTAQAIGTADPLYGVSAYPRVTAGVSWMLDATQCASRTVTVTASGAASGSVLVSGYDVYGQPMSESITIAGTATTTTSKKAFKYISSAQAIGAGVTTGTLSIGTSNTFGFNMRSDYWEYLTVYAAGVQVSASTGYTAADQTSPATTTTGDVRGTYTVQTAPNGANRYVVFHGQPAFNAYSASNLDPRSFVGVAQA